MKSTFWIGLALTLTAWLAVPARGQSTISSSKKSQRYALLVGVNDYAPPLGKLEFCRRDMTELRAHLEAAGFSPRDITFMNDQAEQRLRPSKANLEGELRLRLQLANEDDIVLVAFSGHGLQIDGKSYLCPSDARLDATSSLIAIDDLYAQLEQCRASQKVLVVDACRNEPIVRGFRAGRLADDLKLQVQAPPRGLLVLSSCEAGQFSAEDPQLKHGVFMHYLMQGLKGEADTDPEMSGNGNGRIDLVELYFYAHEKTKRHVAESHGIIQRPVLKGEIVGRFDVALVPDSRKRHTLDNRNPDARQPVDPPQLVAAAASLAAADYDAAIRGYSTVIADSAASDAQRLKALRGRAAASIARGHQGDLANALADSQAAGQTGMTLMVKAPSANLQSGTEILGTVYQNQSLLVTRINSGWLWVDSVNGSSDLRGFVQPSAVLARQSAATQQHVQPQYTQQQYSPPSYPNQRQYPTRSSGQRNYGGRPPSIWETPEWETPRQIREGRRNGTLR